MNRSILLLVISGFFINTYADSATQTDWSGGPYMYGYGPVIDWSNTFDFYTDIYWESFPGSLSLQNVIDHTVDGDNVSSLFSEDIDGDGDMDILGTETSEYEAKWWENVDGSGTSWTEHTLCEETVDATSIYSEDIDDDGDMDILTVSYLSYEIIWWENIDGFGTYWTKHTVGDFLYPISVYSDDIDSDGDMDVLSASQTANEIAWWENTDGSGTNWTKHNIDFIVGGPNSAYSEDIDGDGDMDVIGAAFEADDIIWWENINGSGTSWNEITIDGNFDGAISAYSEDIDGDGDMDVLGTAIIDDDITWWENINGSGTSWNVHTIDEDFDGAYSVYSEDMDDDGDMDVLGAAGVADDITWWENIDGSGTVWTEHTVDEYFNGARYAYPVDIDGDGEMDILGGGSFPSDITWWDLNGYSSEGSLESTVLDEGGYIPEWVYLDWSSQTPLGTSVLFQVRASDDHTNMGAWSDTLTTPCSLDGILNVGDTYVQYRAILETSNPYNTPILNDVTITWNRLGIGDTSEPTPQGTELFHIAPNPTAGSPIIRFGLTESAYVSISIFDLPGRLVSEIHGDEYSSGYHDVLLGDLSPGIYFCRMTSGDFAATQRFVVIK
ncbi:MAG: T9SS type A sorting domain-containing protein [Candidatus Aegiribacteria sp.]|nr:T9SS type A sorting domain-containing protein [Candidatus Aegiribacteria sp.]